MQAAKRRTWTTAAAVAVLCVVATAWPAAAAPWPPADVAGVETTSPLLAAVDIELEPAPPAPAERAEITLALQPPRSWAGLLDLGIPSGESPSLSETRVWGFFLGSADCVGLERLQTLDSTGDASFFARSLRHGVYFARNNPVGFKDPDGRSPVMVQVKMPDFEKNAAMRASFRNNVSSRIPFIGGGVAAVADAVLLSPLFPASGQELVSNANAGMVGMAVPLGPGAGGLVHKIDDVIRSSTRAAKPGVAQSRAVQALQKKIDRGNAAFQNLKPNQETANQIISEVLSSDNAVIRTGINRNKQNYIEVVSQDSGRSVRFIDGEFDTFVNE